MQEIRITDRGVAFSIFGLLFAAYLFTYTGYIQSSDGLAMFATVESMVRRGEIDSNQLLWMGIQQGSFGPDGELYSRKGLGMALLSYPLLWLALYWPGIGLVHAALLLNPLLTAWTGALIYRAGRRLGWQASTATATALIFGLGTLAWPYTQTFFSDPVCGWGLFAAIHGLICYAQSGRKRYLMGSGLAWGIAYLARTVNLITLPIFVGALLVALHRRHGKAGRVVIDRMFVETLLTKHWRPLVSFWLPIVTSGVLSLWWNYARYGSIWASGYVESEAFTAPWLFGIGGLLAGPARGFFWYSPILILALLGVRWFWQQSRWITTVIVVLSLSYLLLYGKWYMWHGGYSWGPRFLVPLLPALTLLLGPVWDRLVRQRQWGSVGRLLVAGLLALSVAIQIGGLLIPFALLQDWLAETVTPLFAPETFTQLRLSPLVRQWDFITPETIHLAWWQASRTDGAIDWQAFLLPLVGFALSAITLFTYGRRQQENRSNRLYNLLHTVIIATITLALLVNYRQTLTADVLPLAAARIEQMEKPGDAILFLRPTETQEFANLYQGHLPTFGFIPREELPADDAVWLSNLQHTYRRVWVISDDTAAEQSGWEQPLRMDNFLLQENRLPETKNSRLAIYGLTPIAELAEAGVGILFGDPAASAVPDQRTAWIRLNGFAVSTEVVQGDMLLLELRWQSLRQVAQDYYVFVHLLDARGEKVAQRDGHPVQWMRPISSWRPGEEIVDHYGILLPEDLLPGPYELVVGLYDPVTGQRLPVSAGPGDFAVELGRVDVQRQ